MVHSPPEFMQSTNLFVQSSLFSSSAAHATTSYITTPATTTTVTAVYKHAYIASIRSNEIVERRSSFNDEKALFGNSELRNLVRLVGIIEGPPPTVVDNNEWFGDLGVASSLAFTMGSGTSNSVSRLYKSDLKCSFGPHTDKLTAAFGGGYSFQKHANGY